MIDIVDFKINWPVKYINVNDKYASKKAWLRNQILIIINWIIAAYFVKLPLHIKVHMFWKIITKQLMRCIFCVISLWKLRKRLNEALKLHEIHIYFTWKYFTWKSYECSFHMNFLWTFSHEINENFMWDTIACICSLA